MATYAQIADTWDATSASRYEPAPPVAKATPIDTESSLLDLLRAEEDEDDFGLTTPTRHAFRSAFVLVRSASKLTSVELPGSPSVDSSGGLRITWRYNSKELRLVCPASGSSIYLYEESAVRSAVTREVDGRVLADKLNWLLLRGDRV